jgi:hypothetical protein
MFQGGRRVSVKFLNAEIVLTQHSDREAVLLCYASLSTLIYTQPDGTLFFLIFTYLSGRSH